MSQPPSMVRKQCTSCGAALPQQSLTCTFCGTTHIVQTDGGFGCVCSACGGTNSPQAKACVHCRHKLLFRCPECRADNPLGSRYCHDCQIEFATYRTARVAGVRNRVHRQAVETWVLDWLDDRWFKARDLREQVSFLEVRLAWFPHWTYRCRARGTVQGQESQQHYRTEVSHDYDPETKKFSSRPHSVPYTVWNPVTKDFDERVEHTEAAANDAALEKFLRKTSSKVRLDREFDPDDLEEGELISPSQDERDAFIRLRRVAEKQLRSSLLERVEQLKARFFDVELRVTYSPVWQVKYRYRGKKTGQVRINGGNGEVRGNRVSLLSQWFS